MPNTFEQRSRACHSFPSEVLRQDSSSSPQGPGLLLEFASCLEQCPARSPAPKKVAGQTQPGPPQVEWEVFVHRRYRRRSAGPFLAAANGTSRARGRPIVNLFTNHIRRVRHRERSFQPRN